MFHKSYHKIRQIGFAYVFLLVAIALIGLFAASALQVGSQIARRDAELTLLSIGSEYEAALRSYAGVPLNQVYAVAINSAGSPSMNLNYARGPKTIDELLIDPRFPSTKRHLRQIYADPLTGKKEWGFVKDPSGYILGIYSLSSATPIKRTNFDAIHAHFEEGTSYSKWIFGLPAALQFANQ